MTEKQLALPIAVRKSNALARARWSAESVWEPRLVALLASKVRPDDIDFQVYEIPAAEVMRGSGGKDYKEIEAVIDRVMSRVLTIKDEEGWTKYNVFVRCRYRTKDNVLELGFHPDLRPHYLCLKKQFAQFSLVEFLMLPSTYSQRLFEFLKSWDETPETLISLSDLHEMLDTTESLRKDFRNFRLRVLEKAHKDIHKHTSLRYEWEPIRKGLRQVVAIRFVFRGKKVAAIEKGVQSQKTEQQKASNNTLFFSITNCRESGTCAQLKQMGSVKCQTCARLFDPPPPKTQLLPD